MPQDETMKLPFQLIQTQRVQDLRKTSPLLGESTIVTFTQSYS